MVCIPVSVVDEVITQASIIKEKEDVVGKKLNALGKRHQTLCVTHLAQIAAYADHHYLVSKYQNNNETR